MKPTLIHRLHETLNHIEEENDGKRPELQDLKRRILLLLADLELKKRGRDNIR